MPEKGMGIVTVDGFKGETVAVREDSADGENQRFIGTDDENNGGIQGQ